MKKIFPIILLFLFCFTANATTYYVSSSGSDANNGTSTLTAWQTISKVNSVFSSLSAGDQILFKRGDTFYGSLITNKNGTLANRITIGAYGSGAQPILTGLTTVSSWTNLGGGVYESNTLSAGATVNMVLINGVEYAMGRTPNADAANGGYLNFESHTSTSITDNTNPFTNSYTGATLVVRSNHYTMEQRPITSISGNTINFSPAFDVSLTNLYGYFVQNSLLTLDQYGEWYYNPSTHKIDVYFGSNSPAPTQVATQDVLVTVNNSYITLDGLTLKGANTYCIYADFANLKNLSVNNCNISFSGIDGIGLAGMSNFSMDSSTVNYSNSCGVNVGYQDTLPVFTHNTIANTGTFAGMLFEDITLRQGVGIFCDRQTFTATNNIVTNTGYSAISFQNASNCVVKNNYVDTFCTVLDDGGGIYTGNFTLSGHTPEPLFNNLIESNVVLHGIGAPYGVHESDANYIPAEGIYLDDNSMNYTVLNNTAAYCSDFGIYCHNDSIFSLRGNILYANENSQIGMQHDAIGSLTVFTGGNLKQNQLFSVRTYDPARILQISSKDNDVLTMITSSDSNYYCRPFDTTNIIQTNYFSGSTINYHLSNWQTASGQDAHTTQTPVTITADDDVLFLYNSTDSNEVHSLGFNNYKSILGNDYSSYITVSPYSSLILLKTSTNNQDTTYSTYQITHDTLLTAHIPARTVCHDSSYEVSNTTKAVFSIWKWFFNKKLTVKDTSVSVCIVIPAKDSTYNCRLCATHDTTIIVTLPRALIIQPNNESKVYGQTFSFTHNGSQVSVVSGSLRTGDIIVSDNASSSGSNANAIAGTYAIDLSNVTIMNGSTDVTSTYAITYQPKTLTVSQLPITITADDQGKTSGQTFTFLHDGSQVTGTLLASGDVITSDNAASTGASSGAAAGTYTITLSSASIKHSGIDVTSSYSISYVSGTMTVASSPLIITVKTKDQSKVYGSTFDFLHNGIQIQITSGSLALGDVITNDNAASSGSGSGAAVGSYSITLSSITIKHNGVDVTGNYTITYLTGTLTVNPIAITVRANNQTKTQGNAFTFTHDGTQVSLVSGSLATGDAITADNAASSGASSGAAVGSYTITLSSITVKNSGTDVTANYSITYQSGTLTVTSVVPDNTLYGTFIYYSNQTPSLAQNLHQAKPLGSVYRYNFNADGTQAWKVQQIKDSGFIVAMTYNHARINQNNGFPSTIAEITADTTTLANYLSQGAPDIISFNNEEPNITYWPKANPIDYLNWIKAATIVAHRFHVLVSNGGILDNLFWYIRYVYQQEGKTDSVALINTICKLGPGTPPNGQAVIDGYKVEIPGLAASNIDYINFHVYEYLKEDTSINVPSGIIPIMVNFLASRTGKNVITTEFGTFNHNQSLFYSTCDQLKNAGVKMMIYFDGDGAKAVKNEDYWKAWQQQ